MMKLTDSRQRPPAALAIFGLILMGAWLISWVVVRAEAATLVDDVELQDVTILVTKRGVETEQTIFCLGRVPGAARARGDSFLFSPFIAAYRKLKLSNPKGSKTALYKQLVRNGRAACATALIPSTPTPTPTATATPSLSNFYSNGDVTPQGQALFEIPSQYNANVYRGLSSFSTYCTGCHGEKLNRSFPYLDTAVRASPMLYGDAELPRSTLADIAAYLNRYRGS